MKLLQPFKYRVVILGLVLVGLLTGCLKEDYTDCPEKSYTVEISFLYNHNMDVVDKFEAVVEVIDIYAYNLADGQLSKHVKVTKGELVENEYRVGLELFAGEYKLVSWMNSNKDYSTGETGIFSDAYIKMKSMDKLTIVNNPENLYYGASSSVVNVIGHGVGATIEYIRNTHNIDVELKFSQTLASDVIIETYITGTNGTFKFDNTRDLSAGLIRYNPYSEAVTYSGQTNLCRLKTQRLFVEDDLKLYVVKKESGKADEPLGIVNLTSAIMQNPLYASQSMLDKQDTFKIKLEFDVEHTYMLTDVVVDDWYVINRPGALE